MNRGTVIKAMEELAAHFRKEAAACSKAAGIAPGTTPNETPPESSAMLYSAGAYKVAAKAVEDKLKWLKAQPVSRNKGGTAA